MYTCNTIVWVRDVLWCAKTYYHTCTHATHFGNTAGFSVPVLNPTYKPPLLSADGAFLVPLILSH